MDVNTLIGTKLMGEDTAAWWSEAGFSPKRCALPTWNDANYMRQETSERGGRMSDLISRAKIMNRISMESAKWDEEYDIDQILGDIEDFPSAEPGWMPCSERLPEEAGTYICSCKDGNRHMVTMAKWQPKLKSWNLSGARAYWRVLAWMPLLEPYQGRDES